MEDKYKVSSPDKIIIDRNVIKYDDVVIQMRNISLLDITTVPKKGLVLYVIGSLLGFLLFLIIGSGYLALIGLLIAAGFGIELYRRASHNSNYVRYLFIFTNSSFMYGVAAADLNALRNIKDQIECCMNNDEGESIVIEFTDSTVSSDGSIKDE